MNLTVGQILISKIEFNHVTPKGETVTIPTGTRAIISSIEPEILIMILAPNPIGQAIVLRAHDQKNVESIFSLNGQPEYDEHLTDWHIEVSDLALLMEGRIKLNLFHKKAHVGYFLKDINNQTEIAIYSGFPEAVRSIEAAYESVKNLAKNSQIYLGSGANNDEHLKIFVMSVITQYLTKQFNAGALNLINFFHLLNKSSSDPLTESSNFSSQVTKKLYS